MRKSRISIILLILPLFTLSLTFPFVSAVQTFPNSFSDITHLQYSFSQKFTQYEVGTKSGSGTISIDISKNTLDELNFTVNHDISVWTKGCTQAFSFYYKLQYRVNPETRQIDHVYNGSQLFGNWLLGNYSYYFINPLIKANESTDIMLDNLMVFRGAIHSSSFRCLGVQDISIQGSQYPAIHMQYNVANDGVLVYTGTVCGIGTGVFINATVDLYYDVHCGVLLYSKSDYLEYYFNNTNVWQRSQINRVIQDINYINEPTNSHGFTDTTAQQNGFWSSTENQMGVLIISTIIIVTVASIAFIKKRSFTWKLEAIKKIDNIEQKLKMEIRSLKKDLGIDENKENS